MNIESVKGDDVTEDNQNLNAIISRQSSIKDDEINFEIAFNYLSSIKEPLEFYTNKEVDKYLNYLAHESYNTNNRKEFAAQALKSSFENFLIKNLSFAYEHSIKSLIVPVSKIKYSSKIIKLVKLLLSLTNHSLKFGSRIHEIDGIQVLLDIATDDNLLKILSKDIECKSLIYNSVEKLIKFILGSLHNLAKISAKYMNLWKQVDSVNRLIDASNQVRSLPSIKNVCYITIALLATDHEIESLPEIKNVIEFLTSTISKCVLQFGDPSQILRAEIQLNDDDLYHNIISVSAHGILWSLTELIQALYALAVNDSIKKDIYFAYKINEAIKAIILNGNKKEVEIGLKLLWQLSFDESVSSDVENSEEILKKIESFKVSSSKEIVQNANGLFWSLNKNVKKNGNSKMKEKKSQGKHIMISYNRESRDLCLKIKKDLEKNGHKIWIDVESIHGSSLETMAKAIEESKCVLMCMTEKYKQSSNCRAEAEYAFQLNKPIIPLIMQQNYKPDGWLGIILGSKIFVNFTKYDYGECLKRIFHEIDKLFRPKTAVASSKYGAMAVPTRSIKDWDEQEVETWFKEKKFNEIIVNNIIPSDGNNLKQLHEMLLSAPEFFYTSISSKGSVPTRDVLFFSNELKNLFNNE